MNLLAIETSTERASIALVVNGQWWTVEEHTLQRHAEWTLETVSTLLDQAACGLADLDGLVFGQGPGSFTGIRIACSLVKGVAVGAALPLYPVSGLQAIASSAAIEAPSVLLTVLDARMQAWYWGVFQAEHLQGDISVTTPAEIQVPGHASIVLAGVGFDALSAQLPAAIQDRLIDKREIYPTATEMIRVVMQGGIKAVSAAEAAPLYVRQQIVQGAKGG